jgi:hypothetical protein
MGRKKPNSKSSRSRVAVEKGEPVPPKPAVSLARPRTRKRRQGMTWEDRQLTDQRISKVVDLMVANEWVTGRTGKTLAAEWGVSSSRVKQIAAEASRIVRRAVGDPKDIKKLLLSGLHQVVERTLHKGEFRTMVEAARTIGSFHGLVRDRLELTKPGDDFEGWTDTEVEQYVEHGAWPSRLLRGGAARQSAPPPEPNGNPSG